MRLIEWNGLQLFVRAERIEEIARRKMRERNVPLRDVSMRFHDGLLEVKGRIDKVIPLPFRVEVSQIHVDGREVVVHIDRISAAGLPVPTFLGKLVEAEAAGGGIVIDGDGPAIRVRVDRFLPPYVDATIESIRIAGDGIVVNLGRGGADPPEGAI